MNTTMLRRRARENSRAVSFDRSKFNRAMRGASAAGTSLIAELNKVIDRYADTGDERALYPVPGDTVLRNDADWDALAHELGLDQ